MRFASETQPDPNPLLPYVRFRAANFDRRPSARGRFLADGLPVSHSRSGVGVALAAVPRAYGDGHGCPDLTRYQDARPGTRRHPIFGGTFAFSRNMFFGSYLALRATSRSKFAP